MAASILIVHGDPAVSELISAALGAVGRACVAAGTVQAALEALRTQSPGVVLLSPQVEQGRGHLVLEALAQQPPERRTPVVLLGEAAAGFDLPVVALPPGDDFVERVLAPERERVLAAAERALHAARDAAARERSRVSTLEKHLDDVELQLAVRSADLDRVGRELDASKLGRARSEAALAAARSEATADHASLEQRLDEQTKQMEALAQRLAAEQAQHQEASAKARELEERLARLQAEHTALGNQLLSQNEAAEGRVAAMQAGHAAALQGAEERLAAQQADHAVALAALAAEQQRAAEAAAATQAAHAAELQRAAETAAATQAAHAAELRALLEQLAQTQAARMASEQLAAEASAALEAERSRAQGQHAELEATRSRADAAGQQAQKAAQRVQELEARAAEATAALEAERIRARAESAELLAARSRADAAEQQVRETAHRVHELETRAVLTFEAPQAPAAAVPRSGTVGLAELARVGVELWRAHADVRLDLVTASGLRRLWLRRGLITGAASELPGETLFERARRDGFIDDAQARELRGLAASSLRRQLDELLERGLLRRAEIEGLLLRHAEAVALEAFSEGETTYRLEHEGPEPPLAAPQTVRPLAALIALALRRALPAEAHVALVGGPFCVPRARRHSLDVELLGFSSREQRLLEAVDEERTVASLAALSGLTTDRACQALYVAKVLGLVALDEAQPLEAGADVASLATKFEQVQNADYFAILDLSREADGNAVRRAQLRLSQQFDPLKFAGHADPAVLHQAQVVYRQVKDAARALEDDRRRADYARHLQ